MSNTAEWVVCDPVDGVSFYATEAEARDRAEALLDEERDNADEGWNENVTEICYARVIGRVEQTTCEPAPEGSGLDEYWDFGLKSFADASNHVFLRAENENTALALRLAAQSCEKIEVENARMRTVVEAARKAVSRYDNGCDNCQWDRTPVCDAAHGCKIEMALVAALAEYDGGGK